MEALTCWLKFFGRIAFVCAVWSCSFWYKFPQETSHDKLLVMLIHWSITFAITSGILILARIISNALKMRASYKALLAKEAKQRWCLLATKAGIKTNIELLISGNRSVPAVLMRKRLGALMNALRNVEQLEAPKNLIVSDEPKLHARFLAAWDKKIEELHLGNPKPQGE